MHIEPLSDRFATAAARLLVAGFADHWPAAWPTLDDAREEVREALLAGRIAFAAVEDDELLGWVGALSAGYGDRVWELHPLVVAPGAQGRGVGRALVERLVGELADRGTLTLVAGSDDEDEMTSLGGQDLYPGVLDHLRSLTDRKGHPFGFYRRLGFEVVGVVPDANGFGKPDIVMARRVAEPPR